MAFGWLSERSGEKTSCSITSRNQFILRFDVILQHDWPIEQCLLHIRVFFGGKTKRSCFDLFVHWLIKQITKTFRNHFSRSYENRPNRQVAFIFIFVTISTKLICFQRKYQEFINSGIYSPSNDTSRPSKDFNS